MSGTLVGRYKAPLQEDRNFNTDRLITSNLIQYSNIIAMANQILQILDCNG